MKTLIKNVTLISMSDKRDKIEENIDIEITDNKISRIDKNIENKNNDKVIDATGCVALPGLINTHAHVPMSIFRETVDGYNLQDWLSKKIWPMEDKLTREDIYYASYLSFIEMIKTGTTTINDMYFMPEDIINAALDCGVRLVTSRTLMDAKGKSDGEQKLQELDSLIAKYQNFNELITLNVGIHGLYTSSREYVKKCINLAKKYNLPIHMHFCENTKEREDIKSTYHDNPVDVITKDFSGVRVLLAHAVKLNDEEITKLSENKNISISHCPVSNLKLGCGIASISKMLKKGINVSLGTDGQGSGSNLDLFESMKYAALLQKGIMEDSQEMNSYDTLKLATINGANALGLEDQLGSIECGKLADLIIIRLDNVVTKPINDLVSDIIYNAKGTNVETTIINGKILMENKELKIKENDIYEKCKQIIDRIKF